MALVTLVREKVDDGSPSAGRTRRNFQTRPSAKLESKGGIVTSATSSPVD
jgi:hypothetical protein